MTPTPAPQSEPTTEQRVEELAAKFHAIYQAEAKRQGDVRHHDDYNRLPENIKEFDRVLARYVAAELDAAEQRGYLEGVKFGLTALAWWKDGTQYVGTGGTTLKQAIELASKRGVIWPASRKEEAR